MFFFILVFHVFRSFKNIWPLNTGKKKDLFYLVFLFLNIVESRDIYLRSKITLDMKSCFIKMK